MSLHSYILCYGLISAKFQCARFRVQSPVNLTNMTNYIFEDFYHSLFSCPTVGVMGLRGTEIMNIRTFCNSLTSNSDLLWIDIRLLSVQYLVRLPLFCWINFAQDSRIWQKKASCRKPRLSALNKITDFPSSTKN